jgi:hypothetical protein
LDFSYKKITLGRIPDTPSKVKHYRPAHPKHKGGSMANPELKAFFERVHRDNAERDRREAIDIIHDVQADLEAIGYWRTRAATGQPEALKALSIEQERAA